MATRRGPDGSVRLAYSGTHAGLPWANVVWANLTGGTTATQAAFDAWVNSARAVWGTAFSSRVPTTVSILQAQGTLFQPGSTALHSVSVVTTAGTNPNPEVADASAAAVISWRTSAYWRGGKPRTYLPGVMTSDVTGGNHLNAAAITAYNNAADTFITSFNALSATGITQTQLVLCSFFSANAPRPAPLLFPIIGHSVHPRLGSQRRRLGAWVP